MRPLDFDPIDARRPGSLVQLCVAYLDACALRGFTPDTIINRRRHLRVFAEWLAERVVHDAAQITRAMIERYQRYLFNARQANGRPYTINYQIQRVKPIQLLFRWAVKRHRLPANPASDLDFPRPIRRLPDVLTIDEAEAILSQPDTATALGLRDRAMLEVLYSTGMRRFEMCRLRLDDIDEAAGLIRINQGKGRKDRIVPIGPRALQWLARYRDQVRPTLNPGLDEMTVFLSHRGRPITRDMVSALARQAIEGSGVRKKGSCHIFRHTMATLLLQNGCDVRVIQEMLGHAKLDTTALYTHVGVQHLKQAHSAFHPAATV
jgi:integrase/recombinase XerD